MSKVKIKGKTVIKINVKDTGIGIKKENISKLFKMFMMFNDISNNKTGTGLGLYISKQIS